MTNKVTDIYYGEKELGKNLYRKKTYYTICVEQDVLADNKDVSTKHVLKPTCLRLCLLWFVSRRFHVPILYKYTTNHVKAYIFRDMRS